MMSKNMPDQKAYEDARAAGINPPASFDTNLAGLDLHPILARGIAVGKRGVAAAEIGVALTGQGLRQALRHGNGVGELKRVPERLGIAKNRHGLAHSADGRERT